MNVDRALHVASNAEALVQSLAGISARERATLLCAALANAVALAVEEKTDVRTVLERFQPIMVAQAEARFDLEELLP